MPGPVPTPTKTLEARGSWRAKTRQGEPRPKVEKPTCPPWLKGEARAEWNRLVKELAGLQVLAKLDRPLLAAFCDCWADFVSVRQNIADLEAKEATEQTDKQLWRLGIRKQKIVEQLTKLGDRFGLSAATRARLKAPSAAPVPTNNKSRFFRDSSN